jgi:hypothetical protein
VMSGPYRPPRRPSPEVDTDWEPQLPGGVKTQMRPLCRQRARIVRAGTVAPWYRKSRVSKLATSSTWSPKTVRCTIRSGVSQLKSVNGRRVISRCRGAEPVVSGDSLLVLREFGEVEMVEWGHIVEQFQEFGGRHLIAELEA